MKKDVIYIDIEDEITGIISKLKDSKSKIVALVPPKRSTVLNSVVNLKLLKRAADEQKKRVVLITSERSLVALAGGLDLFVAKNLHSKPEVPEATEAPEIDDSVIEGVETDLDETQSIGDLDNRHQESTVDLTDLNEKKEDAPKKTKKMKPVKASGLKIPNFEAFRIRVILGIVALLLLIGGWFWAFQIAPNATVKITAQTSRIDTVKNYVVTTGAEATDFDEGIVKPQIKSIRRTVTEQFDASGEKDAGNKASGTLTIQNCGSSLSTEVAAGTTFTSPGGLEFVTDETIVVPGGVFTPTCTSPGEADVSVTAAEAGDSYNLAPDSYTTSGTGLSGFGGQMAGGTTKKVTVVSQKDFNDAKESLLDRNFDDVKTELTDLFDGEVISIEESFEIREGKFASDPAVDEEADKATLSVELTFVMMAVDRAELTQAIDDDVNGRISTDQQSIYESGIDNVSFSLDRRVNNSRIDVTMRAFTIVGPQFDEEALKEEISGRQFSEARRLLEERAGVRSVEIDFNPFWVGTAPSANKITLTLEIAESSLQ